MRDCINKGALVLLLQQRFVTWATVDPVADRSTVRYTGHMTRTIAQRELRNENAKVMDAVAGGETFVVTRNGEPIAELRPLHAGRRTFISRAEVAELAATNVRIDPDRFRADLDAAIDQSW
jgi:prevent-host-death family protein